MPISYVFDTYAKTSKGQTMHFDVVLHEQDQQKALHFAKEWLKTVCQEDATVTTENCYFCHIDFQINNFHFWHWQPLNKAGLSLEPWKLFI